MTTLVWTVLRAVAASTVMVFNSHFDSGPYWRVPTFVDALFGKEQVSAVAALI